MLQVYKYGIARVRCSRDSQMMIFKLFGYLTIILILWIFTVTDITVTEVCSTL